MQHVANVFIAHTYLHIHTQYKRNLWADHADSLLYEMYEYLGHNGRYTYKYIGL